MPDKIRNDACVMGWPISHSLSPTLHNYWLKKYNIEGTYTAKPVPLVKLKDALQEMIDNNYIGGNLTIPLKEDALALMDKHDESALLTGAVNTVVVKNGKLKGFNSDGYGFVESLKAQYPDWSGEKVVIIGTGGAARGIIVSLRAAGAKHFTLINRTQERAEKIVSSFNLDADVYPWQHRSEALKDASLLINTSCLGMVDQPALDLDITQLPVTAAVSDIVYRPLMTPLLQAAASRGNPIVEGLGMLLHQGRLGFQNWFGRDPEVTPELYAEMKRLAA